MPSWFTLPTQLQPVLEAIALLFTNWAILLLFVSIIAVLWNRETAIHTATEGKTSGRNYAFIVVYAVLAVFLFALGTAAPAIYVDALRKYLIALNEINFEFDENTPLDQFALENWFYQQSKVWNDVNYVFNTFVVLTGIIVVISTVLLWRTQRAAGIRDKVAILHADSVYLSIFSFQFLADNRHYVVRCRPVLFNLQYSHFHLYHCVLKPRFAD
jgi:hypothetical protein